MFEITLNEITHSVFFAPLYVSIQQGYFKKNNLAIKLKTGNSSKQTMDAMLLGSCTIGLLSPESIIYHFEKHTNQPVSIFAQLTSRAGEYLISKKDISKETPSEDMFSWEDLKDSSILCCGKETLSNAVLNYILQSHYINPHHDISADYSDTYNSMKKDFLNGTYDYTILFEPDATEFAQKQNGFIAASLGIDCGCLPYTTFCATQAVLNKYPVMIQDFTNSVQRAMIFIQNETPQQIAKVINPQFPNVALSDLTVMIGRYKQMGVWNEHLITVQRNYQLLIKVLLCNNLLLELVPYDKVIIPSFAKRAFKMHCQL